MSIKTRLKVLCALAVLTALTIVLTYFSLSTRKLRAHLQLLRVDRNYTSSGCKERLRKLTHLLREQEKTHQRGIERYEAKSGEIQRRLDKTVALIRGLEARGNCIPEETVKDDKENQNYSEIKGFSRSPYWLVPSDLAGTATGFQERGGRSFIPEEEEVTVWNSFTPHSIYRIGEGLDPRPSQRPVGSWKREQLEILACADKELKLEQLTSNVSLQVKATKLADGYSCFDRTQGTKYVLHYHMSKGVSVFKELAFVRAFLDVRQVGIIDSVDVGQEWINVIVALQGRHDRLRDFMHMYVDVCVKVDRRVFLTVVYFGKEGRDEAKKIVQNAARDNQYHDYKFLTLEGDFSRGRGLMFGARQWKRGNILMFFCDVDIVFDHGFLDRCRWYTGSRKKAYYPILWSFYNPEIIYANKTAHAQLVRTADTGTWRKSGFGMTCQYRDDFFSVGGFDKTIEGWGGEDVDLYRKFAKSGIQVMWGVDRGIYHLYHEKQCDPNLSKPQLQNCVKNRARYGGSTLHLGMMVLASRERAKDPPKIGGTM